MQVINKSSYITSIYSAIVVNADSSLDPENKGRVQLYIPNVNFDNAPYYLDYIAVSDKRSSKYFKYFPWATTLIDDLENGCTIYGSYIDGNETQYIVIGRDTSVPLVTATSNTQDSNSSSNVVNINTSDVVNMAMPIILHNEIGVDISAWTDDTIPMERYSAITLHDGGTYDNSSQRWIKEGSWSIGLIQWNGHRAYELCVDICKADSSWTDAFSGTNNLKLKSDLTASVKAGSAINEVSGYGYGYNPEKNGELYNAIKRLLERDSSKTVQKQKAYDDTASVISNMQQLGCNNYAILIFMADFFNQYGPNFESAFPETAKKIVSACSTSGTIMDQLNVVIEHISKNFSSYYTYSNRRNATYSYVQELYDAGKLNTGIINDDNAPSSSINGTGEYCMPVKGHILISAGYGAAKTAGGQGYTSSAHNGMDFAIDSGTPIYACTSGYARYRSTSGGFGNHVFIDADDGNLLVFGHMSSFEGGDRRVTKGEVIGYVGSTGNSSGPHVHLGITDASNGEAGLWNANVRIR